MMAYYYYYYHYFDKYHDHPCYLAGVACSLTSIRSGHHRSCQLPLLTASLSALVVNSLAQIQAKSLAFGLIASNSGLGAAARSLAGSHLDAIRSRSHSTNSSRHCHLHRQNFMMPPFLWALTSAAKSTAGLRDPNALASCEKYGARSAPLARSWPRLHAYVSRARNTPT